MNKQILLSLILLAPTITHGIENESSPSSFSSVSSLFSWASNDSAQSDRKKFEDQLQITRWENFRIPMTNPIFSTSNIDLNPILFFKYCYNQTYHYGTFWTLSELEKNNELLKKCLNTKIDGYSALSAAMLGKNISLAKDISSEKRLAFINQLFKLGFTYTAKELVLLLDIANKKEIVIELLQDSKTYWSSLPHDTRKHIATYMIELFKNKP